MAPVRIEVSGDSTIRHAAERAVLSIIVTSDGPAQEEVANHVMSASTQLRSFLEELAPKDMTTGKVATSAPVTRWTNSTLSTGSYFAYDSAAQARSTSRTYTALTNFSAHFRDFTKLGSFASMLAMMPYIKIGGIDWKLTDETTKRLSSQARNDAVHDAATKAMDYAKALGIGENDIPVVEIRDLNSGGGVATYAMHRAAPGAVMFGGGQHEPEEVLNFEPEEVVVSCSIIMILAKK